ncbi:hypothetical protein KKH43_05900 [Patescibacteria group bacterium]|nr:hypothetical protein [Patescibacteria group bacterium]
MYGNIEVAMAKTADERQGVLEFVARIYKAAGYIVSENVLDEQMQYVIMVLLDGVLVGTIGACRYNGLKHLPADWFYNIGNANFRQAIPIHKLVNGRPEEVREIGRYAKAPEFRASVSGDPFLSSLITMALFYGLWHYMRLNLGRYIVFSMKKGLIDVLENQNLPVIRYDYHIREAHVPSDYAGYFLDDPPRLASLKVADAEQAALFYEKMLKEHFEDFGLFNEVPEPPKELISMPHEYYKLVGIKFPTCTEKKIASHPLS